MLISASTIKNLRLKNYEVFLNTKSLGFVESTDETNAIEMFKFNNPEWARFRLRAELAW